ncbi:hypothetical protein F4813DRAFT_369653 [Daldinia decipiens]|uniref:uncharacterized protein n=1 Tax=Daldinia decipiens TaxID=326647 RepID=UPI0020C5362F|nr:uncharacterized protein F4813DRAFT_369653 [Daldinia decipiens]KAI1654863.1 hypothetical protein F4813DRAFT_369653 [Daldinia decipiens]
MHPLMSLLRSIVSAASIHPEGSVPSTGYSHVPVRLPTRTDTSNTYYSQMKRILNSSCVVYVSSKGFASICLPPRLRRI